MAVATRSVPPATRNDSTPTHDVCQAVLAGGIANVSSALFVVEIALTISTQLSSAANTTQATLLCAGKFSDDCGDSMMWARSVSRAESSPAITAKSISNCSAGSTSSVSV